jgi:phosphonatase-like hydrolase
MPIKLIVFDMAGTTVEDDRNVAQTLVNAMDFFGYKATLEDANAVMGYPKPVAIKALMKKYAMAPVDEELVAAAIHEQFVLEMIGFYQKAPVQEKEGASETFSILKEKGIKVAIDTGFSRDIADTIFNRLGWEKEKHFDVSITSDEVANGRPFPDMIYKAMELLQIDSALDVAKVGDTVSDLQEGSAAGCRYVIGITTGAYSAQELSKAQHTHLIERLSDVIEIVGQHHAN